MRKNCLDCPVEVVTDVFGEGNATLAEVLRKVTGEEKPRIMLVADQNVVMHTVGLGTRIGRWVQAHGVALAGAPFLTTGGERAKSADFAGMSELLRAFIRARVGTKDAVVVLGGGTLLDVTCWAAAQLHGGVPVVRMPTTPAAMVDAAFSDYAALDHAGFKDVLRVAAKPAAVVVDPAFAKTVLEGVWQAGFAAALRVALAFDAKLVKKLLGLLDGYKKLEDAALTELVTETVAVRAKKGATDLGLWAAHRLEVMSNYKLPHGYAVALGVSLDATYATLKGALKENDRAVICDALKQSGVMFGAMHSSHLLAQADEVVKGLEGWKFLTGADAITIPSALGKCEVEENPDRATIIRALNLLK